MEPNLSLAALFDIKQAHLDDGLLEVEEEHGHVGGVAADDGPRARVGEQGLVGGEQPHASLQRVEVAGVEGVPGPVERHLRVVAGAARSRQRPREARVQRRVDVVGGVEVAQPVLERRTPRNAQSVRTWGRQGRVAFHRSDI